MTVLVQGMLLLDPGEGENPRPTIWTVASSRVLIAHYERIAVKAKLNRNELPDGWRVINNRPLAKRLLEERDVEPA